jgi:CelD/BcsL family acetyltransferase involved in cellulose biosynthesis
MTVTAEIVESIQRVAALGSEWRELWSRVPGAHAFQSPDWLLPWWDVFAPGALRVVAVRDRQTLIGIAPLYLERSAHGSRLLPLGISLSDYHDVLLEPGAANGAAAATGRAVAEMDEIGACEFPELAPDALALQIPAPAGWSSDISPASICPLLGLPATVAELGERVPSSRLRHLRTARRRAARRGETTIIVGDVDNSEMLLLELVRLHTVRWQQDGMGGVFADPRVAEFHAAALPGLMERRLGRMYALSIAGEIVGVYYGFHDRGRSYAYLCGYDPAFSFESPGAILLGHAIAEAVRENAREFHFLRGNEAYKYEWGATDRRNCCRRLLRNDAAHA